MPFSLVWESRGVTKVFSGHLTFKDLISSSHLVEGDERFDRLRFVIYDLLAVDGVDVNEDDIEELVSIDAAATTTNKNIVGAVVSTDEQILALVKAYGSSPLNAYPIKVFSTVEAARAAVAV